MKKKVIIRKEKNDRFKKYKRRKMRVKNKKIIFNISKKFIKKVTVLIFLSLLLFFETKFITISSTKVGLCIICKEENLYIKEFIEHYKNLGYNHIFICDNNDIDGENQKMLFKKKLMKDLFPLLIIEEANEIHKIKHMLIVIEKIIKIMIGFHFLMLMNFQK